MSQALMKHEVWMNNNPDQIGRLNANGQPTVVEIDETKYFHRKYHHGQWGEGNWVNGVIRETGKCFLLEVPDHSARTLEPLIVRHTLPCLHMSDT
jgi:hypothetical protein